MQELTVQEASKRSKLSPYHIKRLLREGRIAGRMEQNSVFGPYWLVDSESLKAYTRQPHKRGPKPRQQEQERQGELINAS